jgi:hypothetical protein
MPATRLSPDECDMIGLLPTAVDSDRVRLYRCECTGGAAFVRRAVLALSRGRAVALGNHVFLPEGVERDPATLAHELTHCGQYQAWGPWRYFTRGAAAQLRDLLHRTLGVGESPYRYVPGKAFEEYGMEQQGQIVEDAARGVARAREIMAAHFARGK